jgi:hypothetical protein
MFKGAFFVFGENPFDESDEMGFIILSEKMEAVDFTTEFPVGLIEVE